MQRRFGDTELAHLLHEHRGSDFYRALTKSLDEMGVHGTARRGPVSSLAWAARVAEVAPLEPAVEDGLDGLWFYGQSLRYDFRFDELARLTREWIQAGVDDDLVRALRVLGESADADASLHVKVDRILQDPAANRQTRQVCMHALWFSEDPEDAKACMALIDDLVELGEDDSNVYFRKAGCLRKLGHFAEAMKAVDRAVSLLPPGENLVHQDYVRERELIRASRSLHEELRQALSKVATLEEFLAGEVADSQERLEARVRQAEDLVASNLLRSIEILGLFLALAGFVVGTVSAAKSSDSYPKLIAAMVC
ncbi:hypothetical protein, partial [Nocardioides sp. P5_C9_2]